MRSGAQAGMLAQDATLRLVPMKQREADVTTAVAPSTALTAADRCDRCGAQAFLRVELAEGAELLFCAHHAREHGEKLRQVAVHVYDETHKLSTEPGSAEREH